MATNTPLESYKHALQDNGLLISVDMIEPHLYLGNIMTATDVLTLTKLNITAIITVDTVPLPKFIFEAKTIKSLFIQLPDFPRENLLSHFDETNNLIEEVLTSGGNVLVHCYFGVSRSATIVIAYLMKKRNLPYRDAYERVKRMRSIVKPNPGFVNQLKLYHEMNCSIDPNFMKYKVFLLNMAADKVRKAKILPQNYYGLIKPDPGLNQIHPDPNVYRCKKCRRILATKLNLLTHKVNGGNNLEVCGKIYFLEPLSWMANVTQLPQGKLNCPKCKNKLGSFNWVMGCQCPCGSHIAPAFYLTPSKVDWTNVVKNVELTI